MSSGRITDGHRSKWFAMTDQVYRERVLQDHQIREILNRRLGHAGIASIVIDRPARSTISLYLEVIKPGVVIGHRGKEVDALRALLVKKFDCEVVVNVQEVRKPDANAACIAAKISKQLEARVQYRRAMKMALVAAMRSGIKGISITCKGRISRIARPEKKLEGSMSLSTLREVVQQSLVHANTRSGVIGVRVTVSHGPRITRKKTPLLRVEREEVQ
jgi:small subunit ribosomal protein S3